MATTRKPKTFLDLLDRMTPTVKAAFLQAVQEIKDNVIFSRFVEEIRQGNIEQAIRVLGLNNAAFRPLTSAIEAAFEQGGIFTAEQFKRPVDSAVFRFDVRNSRAELLLREQSSKLVTSVVTEQIDLIRETLTTAMTNGINPRQTALDIVGRINPATGKRTGGIVGLDNQQKKYLRNMKDELVNVHLGEPGNYFSRELRAKRYDSIVNNALETGQALTSDQIQALATQYENNLLRSRGERIARTETVSALNNSQHEAAQQLIDSGAYESRDIMRIWDASGDERTRESHKEMDGQSVGLDALFTTPEGYQMRFPGDTSNGAPASETINCRCVVKLKIDYIGAAKRKAGI